MMKKVFLILVLVAMVAGSASALPNYIWNVGGYNSAGGSGNYTFFGQQSAGLGQTTMSASASSAHVATLGYTGGVDAGMVKTGIYSKNFLAVGQSKYILQAWAGSGFVGQTFDVRVWAGTAVTQKPAAGWKLYKLFDPISGEWGKTLLGEVPVLATAGTAASPYLKVTLPVFNSDAPLGAGNGYILAMEIPEPGSMVAMLSGLVGLVGFGIRRRK